MKTKASLKSKKSLEGQQEVWLRREEVGWWNGSITAFWVWTTFRMRVRRRSDSSSTMYCQGHCITARGQAWVSTALSSPPSCLFYCSFQQGLSTCPSSVVVGVKSRQAKTVGEAMAKIILDSFPLNSWIIWVLAWFNESDRKREKERGPQSCLYSAVCVFVLVFCVDSSMHFSNPWPGCCEGSFSPTVLGKQTQVQGQVLLLFKKSFPTSSILPLALIAAALIWGCLSQLVRGLFNCNFLKTMRGKGWKEKGRKESKQWYQRLPLPPVAWSIFKWSTVICNISAFSNLADPFRIK